MKSQANQFCTSVVQAIIKVVIRFKKDNYLSGVENSISKIW